MDVLYVLRHGETEWNVEKRMQGHRDSALTARGVEQATAVGRALRPLLAEPGEPRRWRLVSSPLGRARTTAGIIASALGDAVLPCTFDERLREISVGRWEGRTVDEVAASHPQLGIRPDSRDWYFRSPDGETYEDVRARVTSFLGELSGDDRVIVVSHGMAGKVLRAVYAGLSEAELLALGHPHDSFFRLSDGAIAELSAAPPTV